jgi:hypothetical protein
VDASPLSVAEQSAEAVGEAAVEAPIDVTSDPADGATSTTP